MLLAVVMSRTASQVSLLDAQRGDPLALLGFRTFKQPKTYAETACCTFTRSNNAHGNNRRASKVC